MVWGVVANLLALTTGLSAWLRRRSEGVAPARLGATIPYALASSILSSLVSLPLSYYGGWTIEQRYGLSNQTRRAWFGEQLKGLALGLVLGLPLIQGVYAVIRRYPRGWWAILSALTVPFTILLSNLAPILIMPLFNKYEPIRDRALAERIKALAAAQGVTVSDVLQMDMSKQTKKANAMFTGIGNTKRIVLADTLAGRVHRRGGRDRPRARVGHQVHRDIWKLIGLGALTTALTAWEVDRLATPLLDCYGRRFGLDPAQGLGDVAALPLLSLLLSAVSLGLSPIQNAISRNLIERPADRYALDLTRNPEAFVGAMEKLGRLTSPIPARPAS
jgi:STE24 endopeptidase